MRKFAISDIHGCAATFEKLLQRLDLQPEDQLYLLGDYIDRGPDSKGVIDQIFELQATYQVHCLLGNHEQLLLNGLHNKYSAQHWIERCGGKTTLQSFGVEKPQEIPDNYIQFFKNLAYSYRDDNYILVHAGLDFENDNPLSDLNAMIWIRNWYDDLDTDWLGNRIIVHGHTPISKTRIGMMVAFWEQFQVVDIDAGCVFPSPKLGYLCALELTQMEVTFERFVG